MTNNKQQTAVEWLEMEIKKFNTVITREYMLSLCQQAKKMEKEQIKKVWDDGVISATYGKPITFEQYYEQTYGKNHIGDANEMVGGEQ
jgi:hypothetical protein